MSYEPGQWLFPFLSFEFSNSYGTRLDSTRIDLQLGTVALWLGPLAPPPRWNADGPMA